jgi:endonuclease/exonuclease/phosphatase family metal-dependent hydrolase
MKVLCYNIKAGVGISGGLFSFLNYFKPSKISQIASMLAKSKADIIGLVEVDTGSFRSKDQAKYIAEKLSYNHISTNKRDWTSKFQVLWHQQLAILTRYPILETKEHWFSVGFNRMALEAILQVGKNKVSVILTHLSPYRFGAKTRKIQIKELTGIISKIKRKVILLGDFNQEHLAIPNLKSCGTLKTFPSWKPDRQFDYIFVNKSTHVKSAHITPCQFSDHLPLYAELEL